MKALFSIPLSLLLAFLLAPQTPGVSPADIVFKNGNIYTVDERRPKAEAIAIKGDRIVFVGSNRDANKYMGQATDVVDLMGKTVLPGLTDSHQHLSGVGFREMTLNLEGTTSVE